MGILGVKCDRGSETSLVIPFTELGLARVSETVPSLPNQDSVRKRGGEEGGESWVCFSDSPFPLDSLTMLMQLCRMSEQQFHQTCENVNIEINLFT